MKTCPTCDTEFIPSGRQKYCRSACAPTTRYKSVSESHEVVQRLEREIVDSMTLVQLERKKICELKVYRIQYNRVRDYLINSVEPTIEDIKRICNVRD